MAFETETVLDRRRLRRRLSLWRALAVLAAVVAFGLLVFASSEGAGLAEGRQIARVSLEGIITENRDQLRLLKRVADNKQVVAVILYINSPGGTTTGGEALFEAIREVAKVKPVVAQMGTIATSAAYIVGLATDHMVAHGNTITGSVGVIFQWAEVSQLLDKLGVKMNEIKSGPLKANPSPFQPVDEAGKAAAEQMVAESQRWFVGLVATRRGIDTANVAGLEQGRVYSGREALANKLVDQLGGEPEAVKYLEEKRSVPKGLRVVDFKPKRESSWGVLGVSVAALGQVIGERAAGAIARLLDADEAFGGLRLDGLVSLWQGSER
ncbi:MAG: signal peptide peptidase SppA [Alphaproteobacteria bacterium]|jgi:protease-4|nr:MAG: signal peptide peptidase SppA [Alphaproteobacteria bacterium]